jgi:hypothetical protein
MVALLQAFLLQVAIPLVHGLIVAHQNANGGETPTVPQLQTSAASATIAQANAFLASIAPPTPPPPPPVPPTTATAPPVSTSGS